MSYSTDAEIDFFVPKINITETNNINTIKGIDMNPYSLTYLAVHETAASHGRGENDV